MSSRGRRSKYGGRVDSEKRKRRENLQDEKTDERDPFETASVLSNALTESFIGQIHAPGDSTPRMKFEKTEIHPRLRDFRYDGDKMLLDAEERAKREELRWHPKIVKWISVYWRIFENRNRKYGLPFEDYKEMHLLMVKALFKIFRKSDAERLVLQDWAQDFKRDRLAQMRLEARRLGCVSSESEHDTESDIDYDYDEDGNRVPAPLGLSFPAFCDCIFELVDTWTETTNVGEYLHFLATLFHRISTLRTWISKRTGKIRKRYVWKKLTDVKPSLVYRPWFQMPKEVKRLPKSITKEHVLKLARHWKVVARARRIKKTRDRFKARALLMEMKTGLKNSNTLELQQKGLHKKNMMSWHDDRFHPDRDLPPQDLVNWLDRKGQRQLGGAVREAGLEHRHAADVDDSDSEEERKQKAKEKLKEKQRIIQQRKEKEKEEERKRQAEQAILEAEQLKEIERACETKEETEARIAKEIDALEQNKKYRNDEHNREEGDEESGANDTSQLPEVDLSPPSSEISDDTIPGSGSSSVDSSEAERRRERREERRKRLKAKEAKRRKKKARKAFAQQGFIRMKSKIKAMEVVRAMKAEGKLGGDKYIGDDDSDQEKKKSNLGEGLIATHIFKTEEEKLQESRDQALREHITQIGQDLMEGKIKENVIVSENKVHLVETKGNLKILKDAALVSMEEQRAARILFLPRKDRPRTPKIERRRLLNRRLNNIIDYRTKIEPIFAPILSASYQKQLRAYLIKIGEIKPKTKSDDSKKHVATNSFSQFDFARLEHPDNSASSLITEIADASMGMGRALRRGGNKKRLNKGNKRKRARKSRPRKQRASQLVPSSRSRKNSLAIPSFATVSASVATSKGGTPHSSRLSTNRDDTSTSGKPQDIEKKGNQGNDSENFSSSSSFSSTPVSASVRSSLSAPSSSSQSKNNVDKHSLILERRRRRQESLAAISSMFGDVSSLKGSKAYKIRRRRRRRRKRQMKKKLLMLQQQDGAMPPIVEEEGEEDTEVSEDYEEDDEDLEEDDEDFEGDLSDEFDPNDPGFVHPHQWERLKGVHRMKSVRDTLMAPDALLPVRRKRRRRRKGEKQGEEDIDYDEDEDEYSDEVLDMFQGAISRANYKEGRPKGRRYTTQLSNSDKIGADAELAKALLAARKQDIKSNISNLQQLQAHAKKLKLGHLAGWIEPEVITQTLQLFRENDLIPDDVLDDLDEDFMSGDTSVDGVQMQNLLAKIQAQLDEEYRLHHELDNHDEDAAIRLLDQELRKEVEKREEEAEKEKRKQEETAKRYLAARRASLMRHRAAYSSTFSNLRGILSTETELGVEEDTVYRMLSEELSMEDDDVWTPCDESILVLIMEYVNDEFIIMLRTNCIPSEGMRMPWHVLRLIEKYDGETTQHRLYKALKKGRVLQKKIAVREKRTGMQSTPADDEDKKEDEKLRQFLKMHVIVDSDEDEDEDSAPSDFEGNESFFHKYIDQDGKEVSVRKRRLTHRRTFSDIKFNDDDDARNNNNNEDDDDYQNLLQQRREAEDRWRWEQEMLNRSDTNDSGDDGMPIMATAHQQQLEQDLLEAKRKEEAAKQKAIDRRKKEKERILQQQWQAKLADLEKKEKEKMQLEKEQSESEGQVAPHDDVSTDKSDKPKRTSKQLKAERAAKRKADKKALAAQRKAAKKARAEAKKTRLAELKQEKMARKALAAQKKRLIKEEKQQREEEAKKKKLEAKRLKAEKKRLEKEAKAKQLEQAREKARQRENQEKKRRLTTIIKAFTHEESDDDDAFEDIDENILEAARAREKKRLANKKSSGANNVHAVVDEGNVGLGLMMKLAAAERRKKLVSINEDGEDGEAWIKDDEELEMDDDFLQMVEDVFAAAIEEQYRSSLDLVENQLAQEEREKAAMIEWANTPDDNLMSYEFESANQTQVRLDRWENEEHEMVEDSWIDPMDPELLALRSDNLAFFLLESEEDQQNRRMLESMEERAMLDWCRRDLLNKHERIALKERERMLQEQAEEDEMIAWDEQEDNREDRDGVESLEEYFASQRILHYLRGEAYQEDVDDSDEDPSWREGLTQYEIDDILEKKREAKEQRLMTAAEIEDRKRFKRLKDKQERMERRKREKAQLEQKKKDLAEAQERVEHTDSSIATILKINAAKKKEEEERKRKQEEEEKQANFQARLAALTVRTELDAQEVEQVKSVHSFLTSPKVIMESSLGHIQEQLEMEIELEQRFDDAINELRLMIQDNALTIENDEENSTQANTQASILEELEGIDTLPTLFERQHRLNAFKKEKLSLEQQEHVGNVVQEQKLRRSNILLMKELKQLIRDRQTALEVKKRKAGLEGDAESDEDENEEMTEIGNALQNLMKKDKQQQEEDLSILDFVASEEKKEIKRCDELKSQLDNIAALPVLEQSEALQKVTSSLSHSEQSTLHYRKKHRRNQSQILELEAFFKSKSNTEALTQLEEMKKEMDNDGGIVDASEGIFSKNLMIARNDAMLRQLQSSLTGSDKIELLEKARQDRMQSKFDLVLKQLRSVLKTSSSSVLGSEVDSPQPGSPVDCGKVALDNSQVNYAQIRRLDIGAQRKAIANLRRQLSPIQNSRLIGQVRKKAAQLIPMDGLVIIEEDSDLDEDDEEEWHEIVFQAYEDQPLLDAGSVALEPERAEEELDAIVAEVESMTPERRASVRRLSLGDDIQFEGLSLAELNKKYRLHEKGQSTEEEDDEEDLVKRTLIRRSDTDKGVKRLKGIAIWDFASPLRHYSQLQIEGIKNRNKKKRKKVTRLSSGDDIDDELESKDEEYDQNEFFSAFDRFHFNGKTGMEISMNRKKQQKWDKDKELAAGARRKSVAELQTLYRYVLQQELHRLSASRTKRDKEAFKRIMAMSLRDKRILLSLEKLRQHKHSFSKQTTDRLNALHHIIPLNFRQVKEAQQAATQKQAKESAEGLQRNELLQKNVVLPLADSHVGFLKNLDTLRELAYDKTSNTWRTLGIEEAFPVPMESKANVKTSKRKGTRAKPHLSQRRKSLLERNSTGQLNVRRKSVSRDVFKSGKNQAEYLDDQLHHNRNRQRRMSVYDVTQRRLSVLEQLPDYQEDKTVTIMQWTSDGFPYLTKASVQDLQQLKKQNQIRHIKLRNGTVKELFGENIQKKLSSQPQVINPDSLTLVSPGIAFGASQVDNNSPVGEPAPLYHLIHPYKRIVDRNDLPPKLIQELPTGQQRTGNIVVTGNIESGLLSPALNRHKEETRKKQLETPRFLSLQIMEDDPEFRHIQFDHPDDSGAAGQQGASKQVRFIGSEDLDASFSWQYSGEPQSMHVRPLTGTTALSRISSSQSAFRTFKRGSAMHSLHSNQLRPATSGIAQSARSNLSINSSTLIPTERSMTSTVSGMSTRGLNSTQKKEFYLEGRDDPFLNELIPGFHQMSEEADMDKDDEYTRPASKVVKPSNVLDSVGVNDYILKMLKKEREEEAKKTAPVMHYKVPVRLRTAPAAPSNRVPFLVPNDSRFHQSQIGQNQSKDQDSRPRTEAERQLVAQLEEQPVLNSRKLIKTGLSTSGMQFTHTEARRSLIGMRPGTVAMQGEKEENVGAKQPARPVTSEANLFTSSRPPKSPTFATRGQQTMNDDFVQSALVEEWLQRQVVRSLVEATASENQSPFRPSTSASPETLGLDAVRPQTVAPSLHSHKSAGQLRLGSPAAAVSRGKQRRPQTLMSHPPAKELDKKSLELAKIRELNKRNVEKMKRRKRQTPSTTSSKHEKCTLVGKTKNKDVPRATVPLHRSQSAVLTASSNLQVDPQQPSLSLSSLSASSTLPKNGNVFAWNDADVASTSSLIVTSSPKHLPQSTSSMSRLRARASRSPSPSFMLTSPTRATSSPSSHQNQPYRAARLPHFLSSRQFRSPPNREGEPSNKPTNSMNEPVVSVKAGLKVNSNALDHTDEDPDWVPIQYLRRLDRLASGEITTPKTTDKEMTEDSPQRAGSERIQSPPSPSFDLPSPLSSGNFQSLSQRPRSPSSHNRRSSPLNRILSRAFDPWLGTTHKLASSPSPVLPSTVQSTGRASPSSSSSSSATPSSSVSRRGVSMHRRHVNDVKAGRSKLLLRLSLGLNHSDSPPASRAIVRTSPFSSSSRLSSGRSTSKPTLEPRPKKSKVPKRASLGFEIYEDESYQSSSPRPTTSAAARTHQAQSSIPDTRRKSSTSNNKIRNGSNNDSTDNDGIHFINSHQNQKSLKPSPTLPVLIMKESSRLLTKF